MAQQQTQAPPGSVHFTVFQGTSQKRGHRNRACNTCRVKKIRCETSLSDSSCINCTRLGNKCIFSAPEKRRDVSRPAPLPDKAGSGTDSPSIRYVEATHKAHLTNNLPNEVSTGSDIISGVFPGFTTESWRPHDSSWTLTPVASMKEENELFSNGIDFYSTAFYGRAPVPAYYPSNLNQFTSAPLDSNNIPIRLDLCTPEISEPDKMQRYLSSNDVMQDLDNTSPPNAPATKNPYQTKVATKIRKRKAPEESPFDRMSKSSGPKFAHKGAKETTSDPQTLEWKQNVMCLTCKARGDAAHTLGQNIEINCRGGSQAEAGNPGKECMTCNRDDRLCGYVYTEVQKTGETNHFYQKTLRLAELELSRGQGTDQVLQKATDEIVFLVQRLSSRAFQTGKFKMTYELQKRKLEHNQQEITELRDRLEALESGSQHATPQTWTKVAEGIRYF
uniref:Zn(2)-C6 fungal-type domain-containing protein n=1 Tax=Pyricularia oryzae (strain P131) TaxID=1143193 RepID=L7IRD0_PYRO1